jgi:hypothetical protein
MCQSETMHQIIDFFIVNNKKEKTNDDITDNKDSNNNNKCVSVTVSVKTVKKKMGKSFTNVVF